MPWSAISTVEHARSSGLAPARAPLQAPSSKPSETAPISTGGAEITPDTRVKALAEAWVASLDQQSPTTRASYHSRVLAQIIPGLG
jgi:hypothetical protein